MPKQIVSDLIAQLHDRFGDDLTSPQQKELMSKLQAHIHNIDEEDPIEPDFLDTIEYFMSEIEAEHPTAAQITKQLLDVLKNIGV